jgi:hypothetical protein
MVVAVMVMVMVMVVGVLNKHRNFKCSRKCLQKFDSRADFGQSASVKARYDAHHTRDHGHARVHL